MDFLFFRGLHAGTPRTEKEITELYGNLSQVIPTDRSKNIDEQVGEFYSGYDAILNEFAYRSGREFEFRKIVVFEGQEPRSIVYLRDEGLLEPSVTKIDRLVDATRLFSSLLGSLGKATSENERSLKEAFLCGVFQMQLHAQIDVSGTRQLSEAFTGTLP